VTAGQSVFSYLYLTCLNGDPAFHRESSRSLISSAMANWVCIITGDSISVLEFLFVF
jgi:hypothetical protein